MAIVRTGSKASFYPGKDVQFEYRFTGFESYWLTHQLDINWRPKVQWIHVKDVTNPSKGFSWKVHFCGLDSDQERPGYNLFTEAYSNCVLYNLFTEAFSNCVLYNLFTEAFSNCVLFAFKLSCC